MQQENKVATVFGIIFFPWWVIFAYRLNTYFLKKEPMTGGRLFWRSLGWSILVSIPFVGLIYGLTKLDDICEARAKIRTLNF
ncbi:MAG: hypothetical protein GX136_05910 [Clostridiales bacterium]|jgi:hypothetical protein|nr:hypothetical protein [Clostridiales bacterium]